MGKLQTQLIRTSAKLTEEQIKQMAGQLLTEMTAKINKLEAENKGLQTENKSLKADNEELTEAKSTLEEQIELISDENLKLEQVIESQKCKIEELKNLIWFAKSHFQALSNNKPDFAEMYRTEFGQRVGMYEINHGTLNPVQSYSPVRKSD